GVTLREGECGAFQFLLSPCIIFDQWPFRLRGVVVYPHVRASCYSAEEHLLGVQKAPESMLNISSMTKLLLANQSSTWKRRLPSRHSGTYLSTCTLTCFRTVRLAGAGTEQRELTLSQGFKPLTRRSAASRQVLGSVV
uniref:Uncharacterized protein n=1 Tax=Podarcis muralis TaxID=64176 RepID=A0A670JAW4_PODMU